jgi:hypothetical protein
MLSKYEALDQTFLRLISNRSYFRYWWYHIQHPRRYL